MLGTADERIRREVTIRYAAHTSGMLVVGSAAPGRAESGFDETYTGDNDLLNSITHNQSDNLLTPTNAYSPDNPFNPVNRYDPGNPTNPINPINPVHRYRPENPWNLLNQYNPNLPFRRWMGEAGMVKGWSA